MSIAKPRNAAAKRLFDNFDVVIVNPLRVQQIAHESKNDNSMGSTASRNMHLLSPGLFVDRPQRAHVHTTSCKVFCPRFSSNYTNAQLSPFGTQRTAPPPTQRVHVHNPSCEDFRPRSSSNYTKSQLSPFFFFFISI